MPKKITIKVGENSVTDDILVKYTERLLTPVNINGIQFDGSQSINIPTGSTPDAIPYTPEDDYVLAENVQDALDQIFFMFKYVNVEINGGESGTTDYPASLEIDSGDADTEYGSSNKSLSGGV
jgi:hypothetical protein